MGGVMTNQKQGEVPPEGKQKVAQEVEVDATASPAAKIQLIPFQKSLLFPKLVMPLLKYETSANEKLALKL